MRRNIFLLILTVLFTFGISNLYALKVTVDQYPTVNGSRITEVDQLMDKMKVAVEEEIGDKWNGQEKFAKGIANASGYASATTGFEGYQNYDLFAVGFGGMVGLQMPSSSFDVDAMGDDLEDKGDIYAGLAVGQAFHVGVNAGSLLPVIPKGLYLSLKFGTWTQKVDEVDSEVTTFGLGVNYKLLSGVNLFLLKWRGLSVGSGLMMNSNTITWKMEDVIDQEEKGTFYTLNTTSDLKLAIDTTTYTIPVDVATSVRLLYFLNLNAGLGVDFTFGGSEITIKNEAEVDVKPIATTSTVPTEPGKLTIDASTPETGPVVANPKLMAGVGIGVGPVMININTSYYFVESGYAAGFAAIFAW